MTPIWIEGFEHGVLSTSGAGIVNALTGAPTIDSTIKRTGGYSCRFYKTVAATCYFGKTIAASPTYLVGRVYFYFTTLPAANTLLLKAITAAGGYPRIDFVQASGRIAMSIGGVGQQLGPVLSTGQWYRIDFRMYCGGATRTIDWAIDGVDQTQVSTAVAASTFVSLNIGSEVSTTFDFYVDDIVLSTTTGDYPIGAGGVVGLSPNAAGASNLDTNIEDDGSVDVNDTTNPANIELDDVPFNGSDYIKQIGGASTLYGAVAFADTAETTIHGAQAFLAYTSAAASPANSASAKIYDEDGVETAIFTGDMSESSAFYKSVICRTPTGGWDTAAVNALQGRVGYATDYAPVPYWQGLMIQVAYGTAAGESYSGSSSVSGGGAIEATGTKGGKGSSTISALGAIATLGFAAMFGLSSISGGGAIATTGQKSATGISSISAGGEIVATGGRTIFGSSSVSGGGAIVATGLKDARAPTSIAGGGELAGSGTKSTAGASGISAGAGVETTGKKSAFGISEVSGGGSIESSGTSEEAEEYSGASEVYGGGAIVSLGEKNGKGTSLVSGAGAQEATGRKSTTGASVVSAGGAVLALGSKSASGASSLSGGGAIASEGHQVTVEEHSGTSIISGGGVIESYGVKGPWITDCAIPRAAERTIEITPTVRSKYAKSSKRSVTVKRRRTWN